MIMLWRYQDLLLFVEPGWEAGVVQAGRGVFIQGQSWWLQAEGSQLPEQASFYLGQVSAPNKATVRGGLIWTNPCDSIFICCATMPWLPCPPTPKLVQAVTQSHFECLSSTTLALHVAAGLPSTSRSQIWWLWNLFLVRLSWYDNFTSKSPFVHHHLHSCQTSSHQTSLHSSSSSWNYYIQENAYGALTPWITTNAMMHILACSVTQLGWYNSETCSILSISSESDCPFRGSGHTACSV